MRFARTVAFAALAAVSLPAATLAQNGPTLTLDEAIGIARRNNPLYLQTANQRKTADWRVREAYGNLAPSANANLSGRFQEGGTQVFQGLTFQGNDSYQSSYSLSLQYSINSATLIAPRAAAANRAAVEADVTGSAEALRAAVTQQYISVLQAIARADVQDTLVATARAQLQLAQARVAVGAATTLDVRRAEVALGQAEVQALTSRNNIEIEKLRLFQQLGVAQPGNVQLTTTFAVQQPTFTLDSLLGLARRANPAVNALRERERASAVNYRQAQGLYTPTLSMGTGWGGNAFEYGDANQLVRRDSINLLGARAGCFFEDSIRTGLGFSSIAAQCSAMNFTPEMAAQIRSSNNNFPFNFTRNPMSVWAQLSIPVFDNFSRETRVQEAAVGRDNARLAVRARELQMNAEVTQAYLNLVTAVRTVELQTINAARAREELAFAEERYRVGAATFLDVTTSRGTFEQAQIDRINAVYDYHKAFAALESAVGRPLR